METPTPQPSPPPQPTGFFAGVRRVGLWRSDDRWIGGVAGGIAERLGVDALIVRGVFVVTVLVGGVGLLAYGVAWLLLPHRRDGRILLEEVLAGRFDISFLGALAFTIVGLSRGSGWIVGWPGMPHGMRAVGGALWVLLFAVLIGVAVAAIASSRSDRTRRTTPGGGPAAPGWAATPPAGATAGPGTPSAATQAAPPWPTGAPAGTYPTGPQAAAQQPGAGYPAAQHPTAPYPAAHPAQYPSSPYRTTAYPAAAYPAGAYAASGYPTMAHPTTAYPTTAHPAAGAAAATGPGSAAYTPPPPRPRTSGPGAAVTGTVVALSLLALAGLLVADRTDRFDGPVLLTALGIAIVLAGLGIVVSGLRGRSSGVLGFLAILGLVASVPLGVVAHSDWANGGDRRGVATDVTPVTRDAAERGWSFALGTSTIDLTSVPLTVETLDVPVSLGAGDLTVVVPADASVVADVRVGAGSISSEVGPDAEFMMSGTTLRKRFAEPDDGTTHQIHLRVSVGAGDVVIQQEQR